MHTDLVVNLFGADMRRLLDVARVADEGGFGTLWATDHFSGTVIGAPWSRDPFATMGALATVTERIDIGLLVANITNRHPVQLASAVNTIQSLAPGRVRFGVGSGAAPGSRFAVEHDMIGKRLGDIEARRAQLRDSIGALRAVWAGEPDFVSPSVRFTDLDGVVDGAPMPPLIVGASAWPTIEVALETADGVNIRRTSRLAEQLARIAAHPAAPGFEVSVLDGFDRFDVEHPTGGDASDLAAAGVDRRIVTVGDDVDLDALAALGQRLSAHR